MTYAQYEQEVKRHLTDKRFFHSQCVAAEAARLAQRYGADVEKARLAGILHDIMKDTAPQEQLKILQDSGIILTKTQSRNRKLWHSLAGAAYLRDKLWRITSPPTGTTPGWRTCALPRTAAWKRPWWRASALP